jgi:hypothetical protein
MSDTFEDMVLRRLDRMETMAGSHYSPSDQTGEIEKLRGELAALKADVRNRDIEIRDLRAIVATKVDRAGVVDVLNKNLTEVVSVIGDTTGDEINATAKRLRNEIGDATRAIHRTAEAAEVAASSSIKSAAAVIAAWSSELGS